jgi:hypothetical protein
VTFCLAGLPGALSSALVRQLTSKGIDYDQLLYCTADVF